MVGPDGALYVCDFNNDAIRRVEQGGTVTTFTVADGFGRPFGVAWSPAGDLYVQTDRNSRGQGSGAIWRVDLDHGSSPELVADDIGRARGLAALGDGRLILVDHLEHYLRILNPSTGATQILAGRQLVSGFADGTGGAARFATPYDVVLGPSGDLFVADLGNHRIRRVTLSGVVTTVAGDGVAESLDGPLESARFAAPKALAFGKDGRLFVTDTGTGTVRAIDLDAGTVTTVAGTGVPGFADSEDPLEAQFFGLEGLAADPGSQLLYIADGDVGDGAPYHRVRRLDLH